MTERELFEEWIASQYRLALANPPNLTRRQPYPDYFEDGDDYVVSSISNAWEGWKARASLAKAQ